MAEIKTDSGKTLEVTRVGSTHFSICIRDGSHEERIFLRREEAEQVGKLLLRSG